MIPGPFDLAEIRPENYNLSIQYDFRENKKDKQKDKEKAAQKKKELLEKATGKQEEGKEEKIKVLKPKKEDEDDDEDFGRPMFNARVGPNKNRGGQNPQQQLSMALENLFGEGEKRTAPMFLRGPEVEISSRQEVELLKAHLALIKIHIPTHDLQKAIVMPRDMDSSIKGLPTIQENLMENKF